MAEIEITPELQEDIAKGVVESEAFKTSQKEIAEAAAKAAAEAVIAGFKPADVPAKKDLGAGDDEDTEVDDNGETVAKKGLINKDLTMAVEKSLVKRYFGDRPELAKSFDKVLKSPYAAMGKEKRF